jgi:glycosyltransferase involved in cell wall biosynthesis
MPYTVVVTSFNSTETIELVINSVKELVPPPSQVILIDDASDDGSANLIRRLIVDKPEFFLHVNPQNRGQSYSRNLGAKLSLNEYIVFQDDDDISLPDRSSIHLEALDRGADFSYVSSKKSYPNGYEIVNLNPELISSPSIIPDLIRFLSAGIKPQSELRVFSPSSTLAVRKSCLEAVGGFSVDLRRLEDIELACRGLMNGARLAWSSKVGVERLHTLGADKSPLANYSGELEVLRTAREFLSTRQYFVARRMISLRAAYFQGNLFAISLNIALVPLLLVLSPSKFYSIIRRIRHDLKQNQ